MDITARIERSLHTALAPGATPPLLNLAMQHAVFPGGARVRPRLCLAAAEACGGDDPALAEAAAAAIELMHCASLVHDDMPCFDDAATRRGRLSVHRAFGEPLALLAGDALIVLAFQTVLRAPARHPARSAQVMRIVADSVGTPSGIVAGQAWECETHVDVSAYHRAKTAALFAGASMAGAAAAGGPIEDWRAVGERLGEAYQVADDIGDAISAAEEMGKPVGRDAALGRPSAVRELGLRGAVARLEALADAAAAAVPPCRGRAALGALIREGARRLLPKTLPAGAL
ncbi:polyprenyl synthetase family protein [Roseococcus thiosulfatophilus]|uniref:polyprenyl synthetase family protein n=1 Tax=Roseococcus thiosulfatophilus TaxID=35813 RepID=UPI001A8C44D4|nr:polyprenyl synthetase family protein [Roseococcus thiosulfatophilus]